MFLILLFNYFIFRDLNKEDKEELVKRETGIVALERRVKRQEESVKK